MKKLIFFALALLVLLPAAFAQKNKKKEPPKDIEWNGYDFSDHIKVSMPKNIAKDFAGNKRIYIAGVILNQVVMASGMQTGSSNFAKMSVNFGGVKVDAYQQLAEQLYNDLASQLTAQGYQIVPGEEVAKSAFVQGVNNKSEFNLVTPAEPAEWENKQWRKHYASIWPVGKQFVYTNKMIPGNFYIKLAKDINAHVIFLSYDINFVNFDGDKGPKRTTIEADPLMAIYPSVTLTTPTGMAYPVTKMIYGNKSFMGPAGFIETSNRTDLVFGSKRAAYVMDVNQETYLNEVSGIIGNFNKTLIRNWQAELK